MAPISKSSSVWGAGPRLTRRASIAGDSFSRNAAQYSANSTGSNNSSSSSSSSRHYVDPWDLENFMYLKRHWADGEDGDQELSSTPALESAQSDFYYVPRNRLYGDEMHMGPESVLMMAGADDSIGLFAGIEEAQFRNDRFEFAPAPAPSRALRRSRSAAAAHPPMPSSICYNHVDMRRRSFCEPPEAPTPSRLSRRRSFAAPAAPVYYRLPITGGDSSGEAYEDCPSSPEELYRRLADLHVDQRRTERRPLMRAASAVAALAPAPVIHESMDTPVGGEAPVAPGRRRRRHSHCVGVGADPRPLYVRQAVPPQRKASFSRGQLLAGISPSTASRRPSESHYLLASSDDCYQSDASDEATATGYSDVPTALYDIYGNHNDLYGGYHYGTTSSIYGPIRPQHTTYCTGYGDPNRFQLTNYGHLKIDYSCSWRSLDRYIARS